MPARVVVERSALASGDEAQVGREQGNLIYESERGLGEGTHCQR